MSSGHTPAEPVEPSLSPGEGWHCTHAYYRFERTTLAAMSAEQRRQGREGLIAALDPTICGLQRIQTSIVSGSKADFGLMLMDPDPLKIDSVHQSLLASAVGPALVPTYSFVSVTEVSEYVPTVEQYAKRLIDEGETEGSPSYAAKVRAYEGREPMMRRQRLTPDFPVNHPATCFYPMNKKRKVGENWFTLPFAERNKLMAEHAKSGMAFAGKVTQLITTAVGLEDWEWGVTLWAKNPGFLKDIVYRMRFDEASARYAEFGPFFTSYISTPQHMLEHCRI
jgi:chlorite dismutase